MRGGDGRVSKEALDGDLVASAAVLLLVLRSRDTMVTAGGWCFFSDGLISSRDHLLRAAGAAKIYLLIRLCRYLVSVKGQTKAVVL